MKAEDVLMSASVLKKQTMRNYQLVRRSGFFGNLVNRVHVCLDEHIFKNPMINCSQQERMLYAFAIECLMKAIYVQDIGNLVVNNKYGGVKKSSSTKHIDDQHNLVKIAGVISFNLTLDEEFLLTRLRLYHEGGRYPITRRFDDIKIRNYPDRSGFGPPAVWRSEDYAIIEDLIRRLKDRVK